MTRRSHRGPTSIAVGLTVVLSACASAGGTAGPATNPTAPTTAPSVQSGGGWLDGEPEWQSTDSESEDMADGGVVSAGKMSEDAAASPEVAPPPQPGDITDSNAPLRAGSVDDNDDFTAFLDYLARLEELGIRTRELDPTGRIVVTVTGTSGLPAAGVEIAVSTGGEHVATIRTGADGTARFLPRLYAAGDSETFDFTALDVTDAPQGGTADLAVDAIGGATAPVAIDILFLLDATGSMGDEIDRLKATIDSVSGRIAAFEGAPDVRFGMTLYRDADDTFVTSTFDFTGDIDEFRAGLAPVAAGGGGDYPEALDEGLAEALAAPSWRDPATTLQLIFLVADAPPQVDRLVQTPYPTTVALAIARGITIIPIASSESDDQAEAVFRQLAQATGGRFVFLSYGAGGAATGSNTDINTTDYEELSLDDLIVRFVAEEIAALTGADPGVPVPTTTPPTNPEGQ